MAVDDNLPYSLKHGGRDKLVEVFKAFGYTEGAEIGTKKGAYSLTLCQSVPNLHLHCVDPWDGKLPYGGHQFTHDRYERTARKTLAPHNVTIHKMTSMDALPLFKDGSLDFVYIDANHDFDHVCSDLIFWSKKVRSGGIVSGHDYFSHRRGGVVKAVDAYTHCHKIDPWFVTEEVYPSYFWVKP
jgi:predicted O-methyltransferase YrrM